MLFTPNSDPAIESLSRNQDSSDQETFFQSSIVQFWWAFANCSLSFLFLDDRSAPLYFFCCCSHLLQGLTCCTFRDALLHTSVINECLFELALPFYQFEPVWPFSSDLWVTHRTAPRWILSLFFRPFSVNPRDVSAWKSQQISSFWNTQTGPSGTRNHATFKVA